MRVTTVGELIEVLRKYDSDLPVLKSDPGGPNMYEITLTEKAVFTVVPNGQVEGILCYQDGLRSARIGIEAVVL